MPQTDPSRLMTRMSTYHAACHSCGWPTAKSLLDANGLCLSCLRTARKNGVRDELLGKILRVYAHCV